LVEWSTSPWKGKPPLVGKIICLLRNLKCEKIHHFCPSLLASSSMCAGAGTAILELAVTIMCRPACALEGRKTGQKGVQEKMCDQLCGKEYWLVSLLAGDKVNQASKQKYTCVFKEINSKLGWFESN
jgi:hypothetical protein